MISIIFLHFPFSNFVFEPIVLNSSRSTAVNYSRWYHLWQNGILTVFRQTRDGTGIEFIEYWNDIGSFSCSFRIESYRAAIMIVSIDLKVMTFFISPIFLLLLFPLLFLNYIFDFVESRVLFENWRRRKRDILIGRIETISARFHSFIDNTQALNNSWLTLLIIESSLTAVVRNHIVKS